MSTWTSLVDRAAGYLVTHTAWNQLVGTSGNLQWVRDHHGASATKSAQSVGSGSYVKVTLNSENWDTEGWFDSTGNNRFTPGVVGKYHVDASVAFTDAPAADTLCSCAIYVTSANAREHAVPSRGTILTINVSATVALTTSDFVELYALHNHGSNRNVNGFLDVTFVGV